MKIQNSSISMSSTHSYSSFSHVESVHIEGRAADLEGVINDGNELFGTKSGDGFKDLAAYNEDGNFWIDENDSIFHKLKVWMKDEEGNDVLLSLKDADVGAIYLGNASTEHTLRGEEHQVNGILRKTGVFLKESTGTVGTVNHVDLAV